MNVSVIVPVYNIADCLSYCVKSLIFQDLNNIEIILVDDGSTDGSSDLCDEYRSKHECIQVIHKQNGGLSSARNAGLAIAKGEYVMFVDGDDYINAGTISTLYNIAKQTKVDIVQFGYEEVTDYNDFEKCSSYDEDCGNMYVEIQTYKFYKYLYLLGGVAASACTKLIRTDLAKSLLFKEGILHEDEEFTTRLLSKCKSIAYINNYKPYKYVMRHGSIIHSSYNSKRIYDLSNILEDRINVLKDFKFRDLELTCACRYFLNLMLHYREAKKAKDNKTCKFIDSRANLLCSNYALSLPLKIKMFAYPYKVGISGGKIYYLLCKLIHW